MRTLTKTQADAIATQIKMQYDEAQRKVKSEIQNSKTTKATVLSVMKKVNSFSKDEKAVFFMYENPLTKKEIIERIVRLGLRKIKPSPSFSKILTEVNVSSIEHSTAEAIKTDVMKRLRKMK